MKKDKITDAFKNDKGVRVYTDRPSQGYKLQGYDYVRFTNLDKRDEYVLAKKPKLQRDGTFSKTEYSKPKKVKSDIKIKKSGTK